MAARTCLSRSSVTPGGMPAPQSVTSCCPTRSQSRSRASSRSRCKSMRARSLRPLALVLLLACAAAASPQAQAQSYPAKAVRVVVPLPAGGATDVIARAVSQRLSEIWGQQLVIENKGGANTQIGAEVVAKSVPDGYTLLATSESTLAVNPFLYRKLPYEAKDFVPVSG